MPIIKWLFTSTGTSTKYKVTGCVYMILLHGYFQWHHSKSGNRSEIQRSPRLLISYDMRCEAFGTKFRSLINRSVINRGRGSRISCGPYKIYFIRGRGCLESLCYFCTAPYRVNEFTESTATFLLNVLPSTYTQT